MAFNPRNWRQILVDKIRHIIDNTPITSVNEGSVIATILEATSFEDDEQYFQMLQIVRNYSLDTTTGIDLDNRAGEYSLERLQASAASTRVVIFDNEVTRVSSSTYSALPGPRRGANTIFVNNREGFPDSGSLIIARGLPNSETIRYTSIDARDNYVVFNLASSLAYDHGNNEEVVLSQKGNRVIAAGTKVSIPENDISQSVTFTLQDDAVILDGERESLAVVVVADEIGIKGNAPAGLISQFVSLPFSGARVINRESVTNGRDIESDTSLRDRIKLHIQGLSRGTTRAIVASLSTLTDIESNSRVVSSSPAPEGDKTIVYIDDGTGFEPTYKGQTSELVVREATGGEQILQLDNFPLTQAFVIASNKEPYNVINASLLIVIVNDVREEIEVNSSNFTNPQIVSAQEIANVINSQSSLIRAFTVNSSTTLAITSLSSEGDTIEVVDSSLNKILGFDLTPHSTLLLYKNDTIPLVKDQVNASVESQGKETYDLSLGDTLVLKIDNKDYQIVRLKEASQRAPSLVNDLNTSLLGARAFLSSDNTRVTIESTNPDVSKASIKFAYEGQITNIGSLVQLTDTGLPSVFRYDQLLTGCLVVINNETRTITNYNSTSGVMTLDVALTSYRVGDPYVIDGSANIPRNSTQGTKLQFRYENVTGVASDYSLNRTQGVVELNKRLQIGDSVRAGSYHTRAHVASSPGPFVISSRSTMVIFIDGVRHTSTFNAGTYTASSIVDSINIHSTTLAGAHALLYPGDDSRFIIRSNNWSPEGSIRVEDGELKELLGLEVSVPAQNAQVAYVTSRIQIPRDPVDFLFSFSYNSSITVVVDGQLSSPHTIPMFANGSVTEKVEGAALVFRDTSLITLFPQQNQLLQYRIKFTAGAYADVREGKVIGYDPVSGEVTCTGVVLFDDMNNVIQENRVAVGDTYILIPRTSLHISELFNNRNFSSFGVNAMAEETASRFVILSSRSIGSKASIEVTGGTANSHSTGIVSRGNALGEIEVSSAEGFSVGQHVRLSDDNGEIENGIINAINGNTLTIHNDSDSAITLTALSSDYNGIVVASQILDFPTGKVSGIDSYSYYTGLLQKAQWTIDGRDDQLSEYPGVKGAGTTVEVRAPTIRRVNISINVTTRENISLTSIQDDIRIAVDTYVNSLPVGGDIIVAQIIDNVMNIEGVLDVRVLSPSSNVAIGDGQLARVRSDEIAIV